MSTAPLRVALTFDAEHPDRPHVPGGTERVLDVLARHGVLATWFLQGRWVEAMPELACAVASAGHLVGNHSHYHARMPLLTPDGFATDIRDAEDAIRAATGVDPRPWFRLPFGAGMDDPAVAARIAALGYRHAGWDVDVMEWELGRSSGWLVEALAAELASPAGASDGRRVILLHPWTTPVPDALDTLIPRLRASGATFARLDELDPLPA